MSDVKVGIIMGSQSDWPTLKPAAEILTALGRRDEALELAEADGFQYQAEPPADAVSLPGFPVAA